MVIISPSNMPLERVVFDVSAFPKIPIRDQDRKFVFPDYKFLLKSRLIKSDLVYQILSYNDQIWKNNSAPVS